MYFQETVYILIEYLMKHISFIISVTHALFYIQVYQKVENFKQE